MNGWQALAEEWRANWRVGVAAFLVLGLSQGSFLTLSSLFVIPLQEAFGWTRGEIALAYSSTLVAAVLAPFFGGAIDRYGARPIMLAGILLSGLIYLGLAALNGSLLMFYGLNILIAGVGLSTSGLTGSRVVSQVFVKSRGLSLAIARSGYSLANAAFPVGLYALMAAFGWRAGYAAEAILVLLIALPATYFWIGHSSRPLSNSPSASGRSPINWFHHLRGRRIWVLCMGALFGYAPATATMSQLQPILIGKDVEPLVSASFVGLAGLSSFVGALLTGALIDRFWAPAVALVFMSGAAMGALLLALNGSLDNSTAAIAVLLVGLGLGAELDVVAFLVARYFGVRRFSTFYGISIFFIAFGGAVGASALGFAYDRFGNYDPALFVIAASFLMAGIMYLALGPYPDEEEFKAQAATG